MGDAPHLDGGRITHPPGTPGGSAAGAYPLVPVVRRIVTWENGSPVVKGVPMLTKEQVTDIAMAAASMPYVDPDDEFAVRIGLPPSRFHGMTNLEVMLIRRQEEASSPAANDGIREAVLDRLVGKPKTTAEVTKTVTTYEERVREIARKHSTPAPPPPTIDVDAESSGDEIDGL